MRSFSSEIDKFFKDSFQDLKMEKTTDAGNASVLTGLSLEHYESVQYGNKITEPQMLFVAKFAESNSNDISILEKTGKNISLPGRMKKIKPDLVIDIRDTIYYIEVKTNTNLDTRKVLGENSVSKDMIRYLRNKYGKECNYIIASPFWDEVHFNFKVKANIPVMYFKDFIELLDIENNLGKEEYIEIQKKYAKIWDEKNRNRS